MWQGVPPVSGHRPNAQIDARPGRETLKLRRRSARDGSHRDALKTPTKTAAEQNAADQPRHRVSRFA